MSKKEQNTYLFVRHPLTVLMGYFTMFIYGMCVSSFVSCPKKHADSLVALVVHGAITWLVISKFGFEVWLLTIFIPLFIACAMGAYLFYAQHNFPGTRFTEKEDWKYEVAALESSSYMKMPPIMHWFLGNIGYHHIHHLNSRIPFYRLPEVFAAIPELQQASTTTLLPKDIADCFKLKVWDPAAGRMVGMEAIRPGA